jgi:hypothetical protein
VEKKEHCIVYTLDDGMGEMANVVLWHNTETDSSEREKDCFE